MRLFKLFGALLGSLHVVLYFAVPEYGSYLDKLAPAFISLPVMFFFGFCWPLLLFFAFAPPRLYEKPETRRFIEAMRRAFRIREGLPLRVVSLILLWPFSIMNFLVLYEGLKG